MRAAELSLSLIISMAAFALVGIQTSAAQNINTIDVLPGLTAYVNLIAGPSGTYYGVTDTGSLAHCDQGCGTVFQLTPSGSGWTITTLHTFTGADGIWPEAGLVMDSAGNLYGTTYYGGTSQNCLGNGCGVVFKLSPGSGGQWIEKTLYSFTGGVDGSNPTTIVLTASGTIIGTTVMGGTSTNCSLGCGTIFQLRKGSGGWQERVLTSFVGGATGQNPQGITMDLSGVIYGTAKGGVVENACEGNPCGIVFKFASTSGGWKESVIHAFHGPDGDNPNASLAFDSAGNIYGTSVFGGKGGCPNPGCGVVFRLSSTSGVWKEAILYSFTNAADGEYPSERLTFDASGNIYGGTANGTSVPGCDQFLYQECGQVFKLTPGTSGWQINTDLTVPGFFTPVGDLLIDGSGNIFGTGADEHAFTAGVIFEITP